MDGEFIAWSDANIHILTHTLHYGLGVFEGIRCYATDDGRSAVFRLPEHLRRLYDSAKINLLEVPYDQGVVHEAVLEYGAKVTGCTVHFVNEEYDNGPIILQATVPVEEDDTPDTLAERVQAKEREVYPRVIQMIAEGRIRVEGRRVHIAP